MNAPSSWRSAEAEARAARERGDHAAARQIFLNIAELLPKAGWVQVQIGADSRALGDFAAATQAFTAALGLDPENAHAKAGLAHCARARGDRAASLAIFQEIFAEHTEVTWAGIEAAADLQALNRLAEAEAAYRAVLAVAPANSHGLLGLGQLARNAGQFEVALTWFEQAVRVDPGNPWPRLGIGATMLALGRLEEAEAAYGACLGLNEAHLALIGLGQCARARGDNRAAIEHFVAASEESPRSLWPWFELATENCNIGDFAAARAAARAALAHHPQDASIWQRLAQTEQRAGNLAGAKDMLEEALARQPGSVESFLELSEVERRLGDQAASDMWLREALNLNPCHAGALAALAGRYIVRGEAAEALAAYDAALAMQPDNLPLRLGALEAQAAAGESVAALDGFAALADETGGTPELYLKWIKLTREVGYFARALKLSHAATARFPSHFWLAIARVQTGLLVGQRDVELPFLCRLVTRSLPERAQKLRFLGLFAEREGHYGDAARFYEAAIRANPEDAGPHYELARVTILTLDLQAARQHLSSANRIDAHHIRQRGVSLNISQTHLGQLLDEYLLDARALQELQSLAPLLPAQRAEALRLLAGVFPDNTAVAVSLMLALRESGRMRYVAPSERNAQIPKFIGQFWDKGEPPADICAIMATWPQHNPDYQLVRFDLGSAASFLRQHFPAEVHAAFSRQLEPAQRADLFRLAWLYQVGGVYVDADDRCLAPLANLLPARANAVFYQEDLGTLGNNFIAVAPGNEIILYALKAAVLAVNRGDSDILWLSTGPGLLTRALAQHIAARGTTTLPPGMAVLQRHVLHQVLAPHCVARYKKTKLHWANSSFNANPKRGMKE
jgi:tetratricopeptide (TPR) repeat protein